MEIVREIVLPVPRDEAWDALTEPRRLEEWFANDVELDVTPGGAGVFRWDNGEIRQAVVVAVEEAERLVLRWDDDGVVELELEDADGGTTIHVPERSPEWSTALALTALVSWTRA